MHHFTFAKLVSLCVCVRLCFKRRSSNRWFAIGFPTIPHDDAVVLPVLPAIVNLNPTQSQSSEVAQRRPIMSRLHHNDGSDPLSHAAGRYPDSRRQTSQTMASVVPSGFLNTFHPLEGSRYYQAFASWVVEDILSFLSL